MQPQRAPQGLSGQGIDAPAQRLLPPGPPARAAVHPTRPSCSRGIRATAPCPSAPR